jgi:hypothetical protein
MTRKGREDLIAPTSLQNQEFYGLQNDADWKIIYKLIICVIL